MTPEALTPEAAAAIRAATSSGLNVAAWDDARMPPDAKMSAHALTTADGQRVTGLLFRRGGERTVVCSMHPREMQVAHYMVPEMLHGGCAMWLMGARSPGNDIRLEHEAAVLDLAAGQCFLQKQGYSKRVLLGASGGGPLAAFYNQQSLASPTERVQHTPGGRPTGLAAAEMPVPDALVFVSAHLGQGVLMSRRIDPAVTDEGNPLASDESLSLFNPTNGWRTPPESSSYSPAFLTRYREAQLVRVARIDARARAILEARREAKARGDAVAAAHAPIIIVPRTDADPRSYDLSLDPSERMYGSLLGVDPIAANYGSAGFARVCTAESWLSSWSGLSSNATMAKCAPFVRQPVLCIQYTGDKAVFPSDNEQLYQAIASRDKVRHHISGQHQGQPIRPGMPSGQLEAGRVIRAWLAEHNFA